MQLELVWPPLMQAFIDAFTKTSNVQTHKLQFYDIKNEKSFLSHRYCLHYSGLRTDWKTLSRIADLELDTNENQYGVLLLRGLHCSQVLGTWHEIYAEMLNIFYFLSYLKKKKKQLYPRFKEPYYNFLPGVSTLGRKL